MSGIKFILNENLFRRKHFRERLDDDRRCETEKQPKSDWDGKGRKRLPCDSQK